MHFVRLSFVTPPYYNAPGEARSSPTQVIVRYSDTSSEYDTVEFSESDPSKPIYAPFDLYDDKAALFLSWYKPVNFAVSISEVYRLVEKQYRNAAPPRCQHSGRSGKWAVLFCSICCKCIKPRRQAFNSRAFVCQFRLQRRPCKVRQRIHHRIDLTIFHTCSAICRNIS